MPKAKRKPDPTVRSATWWAAEIIGAMTPCCDDDVGSGVTEYVKGFQDMVAERIGEIMRTVRLDEAKGFQRDIRRAAWNSTADAFLDIARDRVQAARAK